MREQRTAMSAVERGQVSDLTGAYRRLLARTRRELAALTAQIEDRREHGVDVGVSWLHRQARYEALIRDLDEDLDRFAGAARRAVLNLKEHAVDVAPSDAAAATLEQLGPAPASARDQIDSAFTRVPAEVREQITEFGPSGRPLHTLFANVGPDGVQKVRDTLSFGVAAGRSPRVVAREVMLAAQEPLTRSLTIARTEMVRAYREAGTDTYKRSGLVEEWTWYSALDSRTCPACYVMHGTRHPVDQTMDSHPNCRCSRVPRTPSWRELGVDAPDRRPRITPGVDRFDALSEPAKRRLLGPGRFELWKAGRLPLERLAVRTQSERWGAGRRVATLQELT